MPDALTKRDIRNFMRAEQKSSGITKINPGLYRALLKYLAKMETEYLNSHKEKKTQKALTLTKEIRDTERDISTIYELRERKILLMAQDIVRGGAPTLKYLIPEEKLLLLRLANMLLNTRSDTRIDFHTHVDQYIRTIAKEYEIEKEVYAVNNPLPEFCTDAEGDAGAKTYNQEPAAAAVSNDASGSPTIPMTAAPSPTSHGMPEYAAPSMSQSASPSMPQSPPHSPTPSSPTSSPPVQQSPTTSSSESPPSGSAGSETPSRTLDSPVVSKLSTSDGNTPRSDNTEAKLTKEEEISDEPKDVEFLKEYAIAGTLESIPQFRGSDLHDYKFQQGEIITLPQRMADILGKQGKLFIIDVGNSEKKKTN